MARHLLIRDDYVQWNARLHDFMLTEQAEDVAGDTDDSFFLVVGPFLDTVGHNVDFQNAVRTTYSELLGAGHDPVSYLSWQRDSKGIPLSIAFLGLSVLAAERMTGLEYYRHLADLLCQPLDRDTVNGLDKTSFEAAWENLVVYLRRRGFHMQSPERTAKRFVRWPIMHALLRQMDVAKLPRFFQESGLSPRRHTSTSHLTRCLREWNTNFTPSGQSAWSSDVRRPAVVRQVLRALENWDESQRVSSLATGSSPLLPRLHRVQARLVADIDGGKVRLLVRAPHPENFPLRMSFGSLRVGAISLRAEQGDAFYGDALLPVSWAASFESGMEARSGQTAVMLRGAPFYPLQKSELQDYESSAFLRVGVTGAILCQQRWVKKISGFIRPLCQTDPVCRPLDTVFPGWTLIHNIKPVKQGSIPIGDSVLTIREGCLLRPIGGLRLGQTQSWIQGAPPRWIECIGRRPENVQIGDKTFLVVPQGTGGRAQISGCLQESGEYVVWAGQERYRIQIIRPHFDATTFSPDAVKFWTDEAPEELPLLPLVSTEKDLACPQVMPPSTCFLGACPWQRHSSAADATWSLLHDAGSVSVVALSCCPPAPHSPPPGMLRQPTYRQSLVWWAETVLAFARASLGVITPEGINASSLDASTDALVRRQWRTYVEHAWQLRRQLRAVSLSGEEH